MEKNKQTKKNNFESTSHLFLIHWRFSWAPPLALDGVYFQYIVRLLSWSRRVKFQPALFNGHYTCKYQDFKEIEVLLLNYVTENR